MAKCGYSVPAGAAVALSAGVARSVLGVKASSTSPLEVVGMRISFDGVTAGAVPVLVELCYATWATNSPGTVSTSITPNQTYGRIVTPSFTGARAWTTEPTVLTPIDEWDLTPAGGTALYDLPIGRPPDCNPAEGFVLRCTAQAAVNFRGTMHVERA